MKLVEILSAAICGALATGLVVSRTEAKDMPKVSERADMPCSPKAQRHQGATWKELKQETIEGRVEDVQIEDFCMGERHVVQLKIKSGSADFLVDLGPTSFVNDKMMSFTAGDDVKVMGVVYDVEGQKTVVASEIEKGGAKLVLRDKNGRPAWWAVKKPAASRDNEKLTH